MQTNALRANAQNMLEQTRDFIYTPARHWNKQLRSSYPAISKNVQKAAYTTANQAKNTLNLAGKQLSTATHTLGEGARHGARHVETYALKAGFLYLIYRMVWPNARPLSEKAEKVKAHIQEKPVKSVLIALGSGYLLGKLFR